MSTKSITKLTSLIGASALMASAAIATSVNAEESPFAVEELESGYSQVVAETEEVVADTEAVVTETEEKADGEAKCGEGKCGEGKCGEGKCGA